ncbi:RING finger protein 17-like isoform X2 [Mizuhopecten yessoensis]|uniref:RING finger protein 17-like isoform X2 n=1 Tax=Mizuhopecten yessoensis TaxID=6573 RepID=UPI000B45C17E|nr:RING finger protein 17-like isoform X2 [Mizuhopecten yessoensis]
MQKCPSCPKCQSFYSTKVHDGRSYQKHPLLLDCGHTFCEGCLQALAKEGKTAVRCPVDSCQVLTPVQGDVKDLWPDLYTVGLLVYNQRTLLDRELSKITHSQMVQSMKRKDTDRHENQDKYCRECMRKQATCRCEKCDFIMCMQCFDKIHSKSKMLKQHQPVPLSADHSNVEGPMCKQHEDRPIEYYCEDDCMPICSRCVIIGDHKKHSITSMEEKNKAIFADMEPALHTGTKVLRKLRKAENAIGTLVPDMKMETTTVIEEIHSHFQVLHGMLQAREKQLIDDVFKVYRTGIEPLSTLKDQMYEDIRKLEISIKAAQRILNNNNEVILNANDILSQLQAAKDLPCIVHKKKEKPATKIRFEQGLSLPTAIVSYGGIDGSVPIMAEWHTISEMPEELMMDDCDTSESITPAESVGSMSDTATSDMIADDESDLKQSWSYQVSLEEELSTEDNRTKPKVAGTSSKKSKKTKAMSVPIPPKGRIKGGQDRVYVTHIKNPGKFFVQRSGDAAALRKLARQINMACKKPSAEREIPTDVMKGDLLLGKYTCDNEWYRVKVKQVLPGDNKNKMKLEIIYLDYGNVEVISIDRTRKMQQRFMEQPPFLMECCLSDIVPVDKVESWSLEAVQTFAKMTAEKPLIMIVISEVNNVLHVDLSKPPDDDIVDDRPISVRDTLVFLELANFITPASNNVVGMAPPKRCFLCPSPVSPGTRFDAHLTCANDPSSFYVQQIGEESSYFHTVMKQMQDQYNMERGDAWTVYCPRIGMICVARYLADDTWYRAQVIDLPGNKMVTVRYVDYGNTETVDITKLCKILDMFLVLPVQAQHCQLSDVAPTEYSQQAKRWWSDRVTMKEFSLKVTDVEEDRLSVVMYDDNSGGGYQFSVNSELVGRGFATSTGPLSNQLPKCGLGELVTSSEDSSTESQTESLSKPLVSSQTSSRSSTRSNSGVTTPVVSPKKSLKKASQCSEMAVRYLVMSEPETAVNGKSSCSSSISTSPEKPVTVPMITKVKPSDIKVAEEKSKAKQQENKSSEPDSPGDVQVIISHFHSPSDFHVQLASSAAEELEKMMQGLQEEYKDSETQWMSWKVMEFCVAKYSQDGRWYRGKIQKILHKNVMEVSVVFAEVKLVDYGYTCTVSQNQLRPLARFFLKDMCFAFHCHMANLVPAGDGHKWSRTACEFMEETTQGVKLYLQKKGDMENASLAIDLLMEEHIAESALEPSTHRFVSLGKKIVEQGLGIPTKRNEEKAIPQKFLEPTEILLYEEPRDVSCVYYFPAEVPTYSSFKAIPTYVDLKAVIYVQDTKNEQALAKLSERLNNKFGNSKPHGFDIDWKVGQAGAAKFHLDQLWYRVQVVHIEADLIKVNFIDFGNTEMISPDVLRADVAEFTDIPQLCYECVLNNIAPLTEDGTWTVPVLDQIHKLLVSKPCSVEILKIDANLQLIVKISMDGENDLGDALCYSGVAFHPDKTSELVSQSHKIAKVVEKNNPYKTTELMPPGEYFPVDITHVEVPNVVYFQHTRQSGSEMDERMDEINAQLSKLVQLAFDLNEVGPLAAALPNPKPGLMCCAQFWFDQCWYRAVVVERDTRTDMILVMYVDYGTSEYVTVDRVRALPSRFGSLPAQSVRLTLSEVSPKSRDGQWSKEALEAIITSISNKQLIACLKKSDPPTGDLYVVGSSAGAALSLAYQEVGDLGLITLPDESALYDDTMVTKGEGEAARDVTPDSSDVEVNDKDEEEKVKDEGGKLSDEKGRDEDESEKVTWVQTPEEPHQSETKDIDHENRDIVSVEETSDGEDDVIIEEDMSCDDVDDVDKEGDE